MPDSVDLRVEVARAITIWDESATDAADAVLAVVATEIEALRPEDVGTDIELGEDAMVEKVLALLRGRDA
jgi:hypothetical protein